MKKISFALLTGLALVTNLAGQDFISDSIRSVYTKAKADSSKVSALIALGKHKFSGDFAVAVDTPIAILNSAMVLARQKKLYRLELDALEQLSVIYSRADTKAVDIVKAKRLMEQGVMLARSYRLKANEVNFMLALSGIRSLAPDSVALLVDQAMKFSREYGLKEQEVLAFTRLAKINNRASNPAVAKSYYLQAIELAQRYQLPTSEIQNRYYLAEIYTLEHKTDSAHQLVYEALQVARINHLASVEIELLTLLINTESGYFLKDSLVSFYERMKWLSRTFHRDSLPMMSQTAESFADMGNYPRALEIYLELLHVQKVRKDSLGIQRALHGIGLAHQSRKDYRKSISYFSEALKYRTVEPVSHFYDIFVHIGIANDHLKSNQKDSARRYSVEAYQLGVKLYGSPDEVYGGVLNDLGEIYSQLGDDSLSLYLLRKSYVYFTKTAIQYLNFCTTTNGLAKAFKKAAMMDSSLFYARLCLKTALDKGFQGYISQSSELIAEYFKGKHNPDSAYYYQQIGFDAYKKLYNDESTLEFQNMVFAEQQKEKDIAAGEKVAAEEYKSRLRLYALLGVIAIAVLIGVIVFRNGRQRQRSYDLLTKQKQEIDLQKMRLEESFNNLTATQSQLIQSEKMASLGELTAGIAHEIQNPLNFVNNFSEMNSELLTEMKGELINGNIDGAKAIAEDVIRNEEKINHHGKRADAIVKGMLQHSRSSNGIKEPTDINALVDEYLRLAYHGLRAKDKSFNSAMKTDLDATIGAVKIIPQDFGRVILNLVTNAFYAVDEKKKQGGNGYEPAVSVSTKKQANRIDISVKDNGNGIPQKILDKIFQPFFTTKPAGQGTGLGLSLSYDIVKAHGGELKVEAKEGEGSVFTVSIPV
jgi:two-component system NtrC family sensor kinase